MSNNKKKEIVYLFGIFLISVVVRFIISNYSRIAVIYGDELRYFGIAKDIYFNGEVLLRNATTTYQKIGYSIVLVPFWAFHNSVNTVTAIGVFNSILMSSCVFPVWAISRELGVEKKHTYILCFITVVWGDFIYSVTFMSEVLYWPLLLWTIYLWIVNLRKKSAFISILAALISYYGYMVKEIFLAVLVAYICYEIINPIIEWRVFSEKRQKLYRCYSVQNIKCLILFVGTFFICHAIVKSTLFAGLGNSYNQMGLYAIMSPYNFMYLFYGFFYYLAAFLVSFLIFPIIIPGVYYKKIGNQLRNVYSYVLFLTTIIAFTISYTIYVREDLGNMVPRVHLRYIGPVSIVVLILFIKAIEIVRGENAFCKSFLIVSIIVTLFVILVFKGEPTSMIGDQFSICWYSKMTRVLGSLALFENKFWVTILLANVGIAILVFIFCKEWIGNKRYIEYTFFSILLVLQLLSNASGLKYMKMLNGASSDEISRVREMGTHLIDGNSVLVITNERGLGRYAKLIDTYYEDDKNIYMTNKEEIISYSEQGIKAVSDMQFHEPIYLGAYRMPSSFKYIVVEKDVDLEGYTLENCQRVDEWSDELYDVYINNIPREICIN